MTEPTIKQLDDARKTGFRPSVICCCVHNKRLLMVLNKEYELWMLPQGKISNGESVGQALKKELSEEMGKKFVSNLPGEAVFLGEDQVEFLPEKQGQEELKLDDGTEIKMLGKKYYFVCVQMKSDEVDLKETKFHEFYWFEYQPGTFLAGKIKQPGKRRITVRAFDLLKQAGLIE